MPKPLEIVWVNAITYVHEGEPPMLIVHGTDDKLVPYEQAELLADVQERVRKLTGTGNIDALVSELKPQIRTAYSTWEHDRFIEPAIRYFAQV